MKTPAERFLSTEEIPVSAEDRDNLLNDLQVFLVRVVNQWGYCAISEGYAKAFCFIRDKQ